VPRPRERSQMPKHLGGPQALAVAIMEPVQIRKTADDPPAIALTPTKPAIASKSRLRPRYFGRSFISHVV
jgi:hypothetical protein